MSIRLPYALLAILIGVVGLALNFHGIAGTMVASATNPEPRNFPSFLVYYWSFLTNLSNTALLLIYLAELTQARWLGWFRDPVTKAGMAGIMMLVMFFYHFMLAANLPPVPPTIEISNILLHYLTPLLYLGWWLFFSPRGALRFPDLPMMLLPGLLYVAYIELRGLWVNDYPYTILDPGFAPPGGTPVGWLTVGISIGVLVVLVAIFDLLLIAIDGLIARRRQSA
ncbi:MAG: hypothetical protein EOP22_13960 [Hyphomicrobiales bacterium]|nr:MAG: hypothetical protein EOP22_13960 [Hyphomicrobiales bacterium]